MASSSDASLAAYGSGALLSYNKYLRVPELIQLQDPLSDPAQHDELLFITIHQTYELWFKQVLHEVDAALVQINEDRPAAAIRSLARIVEIEKILYQQIHLLETMTPLNFLLFRDRLNPASGFQSMQFREIEFSSGVKDSSILASFADDPYAHERLQRRVESPSLGDAYFTFLERRGFQGLAGDGSTKTADDLYKRRVAAVVEILTHFEARAAEFQLAEKLLEHDEFFALWRAHHIKMVERMVGSKRGTGGSEGIGYLQTTLAKKFFPELWEARTHLDSAHDADSCPFSSEHAG